MPANISTILDSRSGMVDALLLEIAKRIQLSPTNYHLAVERYETIAEYLEREGSPLRGLVTRVYPQGSMAVGSVISSKFENDEFDIDLIAELAIDQSAAPSVVLDALFRAVNGEKGSQYYGKVTRCSRCVQVQYEGMHLDVTPAVLLPGKLQRTSQIFHANEKDPVNKHYTAIANPWGFAEWFKDQMPESASYMEALAKRLTEPVPDAESLNLKARPLIALQLLKRWRNKTYDQREGRMPPSVMLSCLIAQNTGYRVSIFDELQAQAQYLLRFFEAYAARGELVYVDNPACKGEDIFTDRWPEAMATQRQFIGDLRVLNEKLELLSRNRSLENCQQIMMELFGEKATALAIDEFARRYGIKAHAGTLHHYAQSGAIALNASGIAASSNHRSSYTTPKNTFFGSD